MVDERRRSVVAAAGIALVLGPFARAAAAESARVIRVGPRESVKRIAQAARLARDDDIVEVEAGDYRMDVASWRQNRLTIRAAGGRVRLFADGQSAEGKAIWVVKGERVVIEGFDFIGARVPGENGAGIRHEGAGTLTVRDCRFTSNEMGILAGHPRGELIVERSEFDHNAVARPSRKSIGHQIYVGRIARFTLRDSYVHDGALGHLVKSRARENVIYNNRITDESGRASYELEFPEGGLAYVVGNIVQQSAKTENAVTIAFGAEGYRWPRNELYLAHNTLVDDLPGGGVFLRVWPGDTRVASVNNLLVGSGRAMLGTEGLVRGDVRARRGDVPLAAKHDYRLASTSPLVHSADDPGNANGVSFRPLREYVHPRSSRPLSSGLLSPGALQAVLP
jgi:hypothetical protein